MHAYDSNDLKRLFGLSVGAVRALARAGHVNPVRRAGRLHYSFQDLIVLRTASALRAANIPAHRINKTLERLRAALPAGETLRRLALTPLGDRIAIREGKMLWESESGQYALALDVDDVPAELLVMRSESATSNQAATGDSAEVLYAKGFDLEESDPQAARIAYEGSLAADLQHVESRINLGRMLHLAGLLEEAEIIYRAAARPEPLIIFNLAVLLEDLHRPADAISAYRDALALDPQLADAHFNLARLYEEASDSKASLRHLLAYRRMMDRDGS